MPKMSMTLNNGNGIYNYPVLNNSTLVNNSAVKQVRRVGMDLNTSMIGRIKFAPAGCGGCGGGK